MSDGTKGPVIIQGIKPDDPAKPPMRMEIRDMIKDKPDQWNLYLLGLERFKNGKAVPEKMPLSYFQIAGIHGLPFTKWPDQDWNNMKRSGGNFGGFCTHSSILFLTWHRPYLALFEAELYKHVNAVANEFGDNERKADYIEAAKTFRMPYWDWARSEFFPPQADINAGNSVVRPGDGKQTPISPNPLATYKFKESASNEDINWFPDVGQTVRFPALPAHTPNEKQMQETLTTFFREKVKGRNLTERVLYILQSYSDFGAASNNKFNKGFENWGSFEDVHNSIHSYVGKGGQMGDPAVSAFDPIFWLHHTNIDRVFAIWQALHGGNSSSYVTEQRADPAWGTFSIKPTAFENIQTPLTPFSQPENKDKKPYWTSEDVRSTKTFGYVYPETQDWKFPQQKDIVQELKRLYPTGSAANMMSSSGNVLTSSVEQLQSRAVLHLQAESPSVIKKTQKSKPESNGHAAQAPFPKSNGHAAQAPMMKIQENSPAKPADTPEQTNGNQPKPDKNRNLKDLLHNNKYLEWLVNIKAEKAEMGGNYVVHIFLGDPDDSAPMYYEKNLSHVGSFATFGQGENTACQNCQSGRAAGLQITGQIPLTIALIERYLGNLVGGLTPEDVIPYLQKNLHWRVTMPDGSPRPRDELRNLLVSVVTNEVTLPSNPDELPRYADVVVPRPEATTNRDGGARGDGTGYIGGGLP